MVKLMAAAAALLILIYTNGLMNAMRLQVRTAHQDQELSAPLAQEKSKYPRARVAVIVAGTLKRFLVKSTAEKMIRPMVETDRVDVDVYASLTTDKAAAYRSGGYMDHITQDPALPVGSPAKKTAESIKSMLSKVGANAVAVAISERIDIDGDRTLEAWRTEAIGARPKEDPDLRFPIIDTRSDEVKKRTANANRNLLRLHHAVRDLWKEALRHEEKKGAYDVVIFARDDSYWLSDFSARPFLDGGARDVFVPSCDARVPPMADSEVCDHIVIARRGAAGTFGDYFFRLFQVDLDECMRNCGLNDPKRGCNSEMLLKHVMDRAGLNVTGVPQSMVPFQRSVMVKKEDGSTAVCFHKFCQSKERPLDLKGVDIPLCKDLRL